MSTDLRVGRRASSSVEAVLVGTPAVPTQAVSWTSRHARLVQNAALGASILALLVAWQIVGTRIPFATSYPTQVARTFFSTLGGTVIPAFGETLEAFGVGFGISIFAGIPIGLGMSRIKVLRVLFEPVQTVLYSTPFVVFFPLLILAFGVEFWMRVACVVLTALFPIVINVYMGATHVDGGLLDIGTVLCASRWRSLWSIVLPATVPYLVIGLRLGFARGMIGIIVIEMEASSVGVGHLLAAYSKDIQMAAYFVGIFALGAYGIICTGVLKESEAWLSGRRGRWLTNLWAQKSGGLDPRTDEPEAGSGAMGAADVSGMSGLEARRKGSKKPPLMDRWPSTRFGVWSVRVVALALLIGIWQLASEHANPAVLPQPKDIADSFYQLSFVTGAVWGPIGDSAAILLISFGIALVIGIPIGLLMGRSRLVEHVIDPYIAFLYALPHVTLLPLMIVWLGFGAQVRVGYAVFASVFAVILNTMAGAKNVDEELIAVGRVAGAGRARIIRSIVVPSMLPYVVVGARQAFAMAWDGVVIAEIIAVETGVGGLITYYNNFVQTANMVVPIVYIALISLVILKGSEVFQRRLTPWAGTD